LVSKACPTEGSHGGALTHRHDLVPAPFGSGLLDRWLVVVFRVVLLVDLIPVRLPSRRFAVSFPVAFQIQQLFAILASANEKGAFRLCSYKIEAFLASLEKEFGADKVIDGLEYYSLPTSKDSTSSGIIDLAPLVQMFYRRLEEQTQNQPRKIATDGNYEVQFHPPGAERLPDGNYFLRIDVAETGFHH